MWQGRVFRAEGRVLGGEGEEPSFPPLPRVFIPSSLGLLSCGLGMGGEDFWKKIERGASTLRPQKHGVDGGTGPLRWSVACRPQAQAHSSPVPSAPSSGTVPSLSLPLGSGAVTRAHLCISSPAGPGGCGVKI